MGQTINTSNNFINVIFENGEKIDTDIARKKQYYIVYKRGLENRCKSLKKVLK